MSETATPARREKRKAGARLQEIAQAALGAFLQNGYRLTQVAHVSERLGVSVGSLYRYVESKEGLFHLAALESLDSLPQSLALPFKVRGLAETVAVLTEMMAADPLWPALRERISRHPSGDVGAEAREIAAALFDAMQVRARFVGLLDRCAQDVPELAEGFETRIRRRLVGDLVTWAVRRDLVQGGRVEAEALARGAMEAAAWLASSQIAEAQARAAAVRIFAGAFD
jgi:AcrR family transcriptional regulator